METHKKIFYNTAYGLHLFEMCLNIVKLFKTEQNEHMLHCLLSYGPLWKRGPQYLQFISRQTWNHSYVLSPMRTNCLNALTRVKYTHWKEREKHALYNTEFKSKTILMSRMWKTRKNYCTPLRLRTEKQA